MPPISYIHNGAGSGEQRDLEMEFAQHGHTNMALQSSDVNTGDRGVQWNHSASGAHYYSLSGDTLAGRIHVFSGLIRLSAAPTSDIALITDGSDRLIRINTDRRIEIYDRNGNLLHTGSHQISTTALERVTVFFDHATLSTVWVVCVIEDVEDFAFDSGLTPSEFWTGDFRAGDTLGSRGADLFGDDFARFHTDIAGDAPHLVRFPKFVGVGGYMRPPVGDGSHTAWSNNGYLEVDESPPDDDTTEVGTLAKADKETYTFGTSNYVPSGYEIIEVSWRARTQLTDAAKLGTDGLFRDAAGNESVITVTAGTTSYTTKWVNANANRPAGGDWVDTDFAVAGSPARSDLQFGFQSHDDPGSDTGVNATAIYCPEVWCYDPAAGSRLPLTSTPIAANFGWRTLPPVMINPVREVVGY